MAVCAFDNFLDLSGSTEPSAAHKLSASGEPSVSNFHRDENWERQHNARCGHGAFSVSGAMHHIEDNCAQGWGESRENGHNFAHGLTRGNRVCVGQSPPPGTNVGVRDLPFTQRFFGNGDFMRA